MKLTCFCRSIFFLSTQIWLLWATQKLIILLCCIQKCVTYFPQHATDVSCSCTVSSRYAQWGRLWDEAVLFNLCLRSVSLCHGCLVWWVSGCISHMRTWGLSYSWWYTLISMALYQIDTYVVGKTMNLSLKSALLFRLMKFFFFFLHVSELHSIHLESLVIMLLNFCLDEHASSQLGFRKATAHRTIGCGRQWSEVWHVTITWGTLPCQAWLTFICHSVVEIGDATSSATYAHIWPHERKWSLRLAFR